MTSPSPLTPPPESRPDAAPTPPADARPAAVCSVGPAAPHPVMALLAHGVPLSLLLDLASPQGPDSVAINSAERPEGDALWLEQAQATDRLRSRYRSASG